MNAKCLQALTIRSHDVTGRHHYDFFLTEKGDLTILHHFKHDSTVVNVSPETTKMIYQMMKAAYEPDEEKPDDE